MKLVKNKKENISQLEFQSLHSESNQSNQELTLFDKIDQGFLEIKALMKQEAQMQGFVKMMLN